MTEHVQTGASTNFIIVTAKQMQALNLLLFSLIRDSHVHINADPRCQRPDAMALHELLKTWEGLQPPPVNETEHK